MGAQKLLDLIRGFDAGEDIWLFLLPPDYAVYSVQFYGTLCAVCTVPCLNLNINLYFTAFPLLSGALWVTIYTIILLRL